MSKLCSALGAKEERTLFKRHTLRIVLMGRTGKQGGARDTPVLRIKKNEAISCLFEGPSRTGNKSSVPGRPHQVFDDLPTWFFFSLDTHTRRGQQKGRRTPDRFEGPWEKENRKMKRRRRRRRRRRDQRWKLRKRLECETWTVFFSILFFIFYSLFFLSLN